MKQLVQLQKDIKKLDDAGVGVAAISYDAVEVLAKFAKNQKIEFPLLSDPDHKTIEAYGLLNKEVSGKFEGIPYPGTMIVDKDGMIRAKLFYEGYAKRHTAEDIVKAAKGIKP
jgi:peroxiredoxin Q/BCP